MTKPPAPKPGRPRPAPPAAAQGGERIAKLLARRGIASRRAAEAMIAEGRVSVNGRVIDTPARNVGPRDRIEVDGRPLPEPAPVRLWLYHKPAGLVTSEKDEKGRPTVFAALPPELGRVMSVGRLDLNSEGLLLLTNDGALKRRLELPSTGWLRKYRVRVNGAPTDAALEPLRRGIVVEGERFQPMEVALDRQQGANAWLTVGLREGRNREVRRAMEAVGLVVNRLIRIGYGPFRLGEVRPGAVQEVRPKVLRDQLGLAADAPGGAPEGARGDAAERRAKGGAKTAGRAGAAAPGDRSAAGAGGRPAGPDRQGRRAGADGGPWDRGSRGPGGTGGGKAPGKGEGAAGRKPATAAPRGPGSGARGAGAGRDGGAPSAPGGRAQRPGRGPAGKGGPGGAPRGPAGKGKPGGGPRGPAGKGKPGGGPTGGGRGPGRPPRGPRKG